MAPSWHMSSILALSVAATSGASPVDFLQSVKAGQVPKSDLEIVLAQHKEDASWSDPYKNVRTVYCKGGDSCHKDSVKLENVGREGHTFLHHIVNNYDKLAKWTVFSQAGQPSEGYFGQSAGGGHLLTGATFDDYLRQSQSGKDSHFMFTSKVQYPTLAHSLRTTFRTARNEHTPSVELEHTCPVTTKDTWAPFKNMGRLRQFLADKCSLEEAGLSDALKSFWEEYLQVPLPPHGVIHYAQGARFAASRELIRQRPQAYYEQLLQAVSADEDPCVSYLLEWSWYYIIGKHSKTPCEVTSADAQAHLIPAMTSRILTSKGVSGVDGSDGSDGKDGADGKDGMDGKDGSDGKDGMDGADGKDGKDGADGVSGPKDDSDSKGDDSKGDDSKGDDSKGGDDESKGDDSKGDDKASDQGSDQASDQGSDQASDQGSDQGSDDQDSSDNQGTDSKGNNTDTNKVEIVTGSINLQVADPEAFVNDASASTKVGEALAESLGCEASWIEVELSLVDAPARRLQGSRKLQAAKLVKVDYTITVPADNTDAGLSASSLMAKLPTSKDDAMATTMATNIGAKTGATVTVVEVVAPTKETVDVTTTTQAVQEVPGSGACRHAVPVSLAAVLSAMLFVQ